jgi:hypothetical protein
VKDIEIYDSGILQNLSFLGSRLVIQVLANGTEKFFPKQNEQGLALTASTGHLLQADLGRNHFAHSSPS